LAPTVWDAGLRAFGLLHIRPLQATRPRFRRALEVKTD
jgi:hypothetical protein